MEKDKFIKYIKSEYCPLYSFILASVAAFLFLSYSEVLSSGRYCILQGDLLEIYIPAVKDFFRNILDGNNPFFSWTNSLGMSTVAYIASYSTFSIFNLLFLLLFNVDYSVAAALVYILKTGAVAASFTYFYRKVFCENNTADIADIGNNEKNENYEMVFSDTAAVIFSLFYSFCAFQISYNKINIIWIDALYILPLLIACIIDFVKKGKCKALIFLYFYLFIYQFYMAYIIGICSFIFFVLYLLIYYRKDTIKKLALYACCVISAALLASFILLPAAYFIFTHAAKDATSIYWTGTNILDTYNQLFIGQTNGPTGFYPYIYCGIPALILLPCFFISKKSDKKEKLLMGISLAFLLLCCILMPLNLFMHAFDAPDGWCFRFSFIISFVLCIIGARACRYLSEIGKLKAVVIVLFNIIAYILIGLLQHKGAYASYSGNSASFAVINAFILIIWTCFGFAFVRYGKEDKYRSTLIALAIFMTLIECIGAGYISYYKRLDTYPETIEDRYFAWRDNLTLSLEGIDDNEDNDFYRIDTINDYLYNSDTYMGYKGINDFCTTENYNVRRFYEKVGLYSSPRLMLGHGASDFIYSILDVRYVIDIMNPLRQTETKLEPDVITSDYPLALGFAVSEGMADFSFPGRDIFENQNALISDMTGSDIRMYIPVASGDISVSENGISLREGIEGQKVLERTGEGGLYDIIYSIPLSDMTAYCAFDAGTSQSINGMPYLLGGDENNIFPRGQFGVLYSKEMQKDDSSYFTDILMDDTSIPAVFYYDAYFYYYDKAEFEKGYNILNDCLMNIEEYDNTHIKASIVCEEDKTLLFTSVPYDEGWKVYVDGFEADKLALLEGAFIGIDLESPGEHDIYFEYHVPMMNIGLMISAVSAIILLICGIIYIIRKNKNKYPA